MKKIIIEDNFVVSRDDFLGQIPENTIDEVIKILSIDGNALFPNQDVVLKRTVKETLWLELAIVVHAWGKPSATELEISPSNLKKYADSLNGALSKSISILKDLEYESLFNKGTKTKEFIVADRIRSKSKSYNTEPYRSVSALIIKQEYESNGKWGEYCPLDRELPEAIKQLQNISKYISSVIDDLSLNVKERGKNKIIKDIHDDLIWNLCCMYKKYSGKKPVSWTTGDNDKNPHKVSGDVIPYLQAILPQTYYIGDVTPTALQKKIYRISKNPKYKYLWEDTKK
jgi:hypothetical protein